MANPVPSRTPRRWWPAALAAAGALLSACEPPNRVAAPSAPPPVVPHAESVYPHYAGSHSCRDCHQAEYAEWAKSNHGLAERPWTEALDRAAFDPAREVLLAGRTNQVLLAEGHPRIVAAGPKDPLQVFTAGRVIGNDPLRQFLVPAEGGRWQATELAWDPRRAEWFGVFGAEARHPGEWGHWTGRGMNWNTMCAACHNTRVRKNYDEAADRFATTMAEPTVGCESCHGPMRTHAEFRRANPDPRAREPARPALTRDQVSDTCATCHSRRTEITGDFVPGDAYLDHHLLTVPDLSDLYYADGQVRDELYEYGSFLGSRMHAAGVRCVDCHNPHAAAPRVQGDALCMQCHANGGAFKAPVINPAAHTFHRPESAGARCTACHMPVTTYMARDPRHDHGFTIPDPQLTVELGVPNACNRCHTDQTAEWSRGHVDLWYGERMQRPSRERARRVAAARKGDPAARGPLLDSLKTETNVYWRASTVRLLEQWVRDPAVAGALAAGTRDPHALVRAHAAQALAGAASGGLAPARTALNQALGDPSRAVRVAAAWGVRDTVDPASPAGRELEHSLAHNADQPAGRMQRAAQAAARGRSAEALEHLRTAARWDPYSAAIRHDLAVALSGAGQTREALAELQAAVKLEPANPDFTYSLALAWNEVGNLEVALAFLERTTTLDPAHARAWYNLGLARNAKGDREGGLAALLRAEAADPADPAPPYARATILLPLGREEEARAAAREALRRDPNHAEARTLLGTPR